MFVPDELVDLVEVENHPLEEDCSSVCVRVAAFPTRPSKQALKTDRDVCVSAPQDEGNYVTFQTYTTSDNVPGWREIPALVGLSISL